MAAPTRLETVNTRPMIGRPSRSAAANPNTSKQLMRSVEKEPERPTSVIPFAFFHKYGDLVF